ncbi:MAG TPA: cytochrome c-type biogenesis protein CcmH [Terriglobales bacterium]|nr:cytochrome c-type biogenesis protein CcmH [Terriglobales bacterium]
MKASLSRITASFQAGRAIQLAALLLAVFIFAGVDNDARFNDLGHRLICVCGCNQILLECNHVGCQYSTKMRNELAAAIDHGDNDDLTLQAMVQNYGPTVIAAPTTTGFNRVAWIMPYMVLALGLVMAGFIVRTWKTRPAAPGSAPAAGSGELDEFREQARKETDL